MQSTTTTRTIVNRLLTCSPWNLPPGFQANNIHASSPSFCSVPTLKSIVLSNSLLESFYFVFTLRCMSSQLPRGDNWVEQSLRWTPVRWCPPRGARNSWVIFCNCKNKVTFTQWKSQIYGSKQKAYCLHVISGVKHPGKNTQKKDSCSIVKMVKCTWRQKMN